MKILAIDTSSIYASVAIMSEGKIIYEQVCSNSKTHSDFIMIAVEEALKFTTLTAKDIDLYVAVAGPGSFTGVRIGVGCIKGLAHATNKPCLSINSLYVLAKNVNLLENTIIAPMFDARNSQVYVAQYCSENGALIEKMPMIACSIEEFLSKCKDHGKIIFLGDGAQINREYISNVCKENAIFVDASLNYIRAAVACEIAKNIMPSEYTSANDIKPIYLREPSAIRNKK